jgi:hypothetical protein
MERQLRFANRSVSAGDPRGVSAPGRRLPDPQALHCHARARRLLPAVDASDPLVLAAAVAILLIAQGLLHVSRPAVPVRT